MPAGTFARGGGGGESTEIAPWSRAATGKRAGCEPVDGRRVRTEDPFSCSRARSVLRLGFGMFCVSRVWKGREGEEGKATS
jgi:hypothetical protein